VQFESPPLTRRAIETVSNALEWMRLEGAKAAPPLGSFFGVKQKATPHLVGGERPATDKFVQVGGLPAQDFGQRLYCPRIRT